MRTSDSTALLAAGLSSRDDMEALLRELGFSAVHVDGRDSLRDFTDPVALCLIDLRENGEALRITRAVRAQHPQAIVIGVADPARPYAAAEAIRAGVFDVLPRPAAGWRFAGLDLERARAGNAGGVGSAPFGRVSGVWAGRQFAGDASGHGPGAARGVRSLRDPGVW